MQRVNGIPALGFGTYGRWGGKGEAALNAALATGYRHLDTAQSYDTEAECGRVLAKSGLARDDVFVTTKIDTGNFGPGLLEPSLRRSLDLLQLDCVDLVLIHWPSPNGKIALPVYLEQLAQAHQAGLTRHVGVSNFTVDLIGQSRRILGDLPILTNQVELHPFLQNRKLAAHCSDLGIAVTAYRPIAEGRVNDDPMMQKIAAAHGATPAQVAIAFHLAEGRVAIPTSRKPSRIKENFGAVQVMLTPEDIAAIRALDRGERYINPAWGPKWD